MVNISRSGKCVVGSCEYFCRFFLGIIGEDLWGSGNDMCGNFSSSGVKI